VLGGHQPYNTNTNCFITCKIKIVNVLYYQRFLTFYTITLIINSRIYLLMVTLLIKYLISYWLFLSLTQYTLRVIFLIFVYLYKIFLYLGLQLHTKFRGYSHLLKLVWQPPHLIHGFGATSCLCTYVLM